MMSRNETCSIINDKDVDSKSYYLMQWTPTWVPQSQIGNAMVLVAEYKKRKQKGGKGRGRLHASKSGKQAIAEALYFNLRLAHNRRGRY
jgi:hypothetical protein